MTVQLMPFTLTSRLDVLEIFLKFLQRDGGKVVSRANRESTALWIGMGGVQSVSHIDELAQKRNQSLGGFFMVLEVVEQSLVKFFDRAIFNYVRVFCNILLIRIRLFLLQDFRSKCCF
jgi:hypothetical protein